MYPETKCVCLLNSILFLAVSEKPEQLISDILLQLSQVKENLPLTTIYTSS